MGQNVAVTRAPRLTDPTMLHRHLDPLLRIPSLGGSPAETHAQEAMADYLADMGLEVHTWAMDLEHLMAQPDFPGMEVTRSQGLGVLAIWRGSGNAPALMLNGHTDVVPPGDISAWDHDPFAPHHQVVDGEPAVIARGACDMKGGLIAACEAIRSLRTAGLTPRGDIVIAPVIGEEDGGLGTYALIREGLPQFYPEPFQGAIIPEPTDMAIIPANAGALTFRLRVFGSAIHASRRSDGVSAVDKFYPILTALQELEQRRNSAVDPLMSRWKIAYPLSVGTVHAGDWASTVPDLLRAEGRYGVALGEDTRTAQQEFEDCIAEVCASDPWLAEHPVEVQWWGGQFASGQTDPQAPILDYLRQAHAAHSGTVPDHYAAPYGSDLRLLVGMASIPTVQYGPGDAVVAHAPNEYVTDKQLLQTHDVVAEMVVTTLT